MGAKPPLDPRSEGSEHDAPSAEDVERALLDSSAGDASNEFRSRLRNDFVESSSSINLRREEAPRGPLPPLEDVEALLVGNLRSPGAAHAFRSELRASFRHGRATEAPPRAPASRRRPAGGGWGRRLAVALAAAAALVAVTFLLPSEPRWRVESVLDLAADPGAGGAPLTRADQEAIADRLHLGDWIETADRTLRVDLDGELFLRLLPGTEVQVAPLPLLGGEEPLRFELRSGEIYVETLAGYPGNELLIRTPHALVKVLGTTLGVLVDETGTCTCVADGEVWVEDASGAAPAAGSAASQVAGMKVSAHRLLQIPAQPGLGPRGMRFEEVVDATDREHTRGLQAFAALR